MTRTTPLAVSLLAALATGCANGHQVHVGTHEVSAPLDAIVFTGDAVSVELVATEGTLTTVDEFRDSTGTRPEVAVEVHDNVLYIDSDCPLFGRCSSSFEITAPADLDLDVDGRAGRVYVSGLDGQLTVDTGAGSISITGR